MLHCMSTHDCSTNTTRYSLVQRAASQCNDLVSFICTYLDPLVDKVLIAILFQASSVAHWVKLHLVSTCCAFCLQISEIHVTGESQDMTAKERLLLWSQQITEGYVGVRCDNFTTSWRDGRLFNAIIHKYRWQWIKWDRKLYDSFKLVAHCLITVPWFNPGCSFSPLQARHGWHHLCVCTNQPIKFGTCLLHSRATGCAPTLGPRR